MKMTTPPKSVNFKVDKIPEDEGEELFDCKEHKTGVEPDTYRWWWWAEKRCKVYRWHGCTTAQLWR